MSKPKENLATLAKAWEDMAKSCKRVAASSKDEKLSQEMLSKADAYADCASSLISVIKAVYR